MDKQEVIIRFDKVSFKYGDNKTTLDEADFLIRKNSKITIMGQNGAGKSTILKMIAGIETITSGKIYFNDMVVNDLPPHARNYRSSPKR